MQLLDLPSNRRQLSSEHFRGGNFPIRSCPVCASSFCEKALSGRGPQSRGRPLRWRIPIPERVSFPDFDESSPAHGTSILAFGALLRQYRRMTYPGLAARTIELGRAAGFDLCGIAPAAEFPELAHLDDWLERGHAGEMQYLRDTRRRSPTDAMQGARSVIVCALNYNTALPASTDAATPADSDEGPRGWISRYAWGDDYHAVLGEKLEALIVNLRAESPEPFEARACCSDTGPIIEARGRKIRQARMAGEEYMPDQLRRKWVSIPLSRQVILTTLDLAAPRSVRAETAAPDFGYVIVACALQACPTGRDR